MGKVENKTSKLYKVMIALTIAFTSIFSLNITTRGLSARERINASIEEKLADDQLSAQLLLTILPNANQEVESILTPDGDVVSKEELTTTNGSVILEETVSKNKTYEYEVRYTETKIDENGENSVEKKEQTVSYEVKDIKTKEDMFLTITGKDITVESEKELLNGIRVLDEDKKDVTEKSELKVLDKGGFDINKLADYEVSYIAKHPITKKEFSFKRKVKLVKKVVPGVEVENKTNEILEEVNDTRTYISFTNPQSNAWTQKVPSYHLGFTVNIHANTTGNKVTITLPENVYLSDNGANLPSDKAGEYSFDSKVENGKTIIEFVYEDSAVPTQDTEVKTLSFNFPVMQDKYIEVLNEYQGEYTIDMEFKNNEISQPVKVSETKKFLNTIGVRETGVSSIVKPADSEYAEGTIDLVFDKDMTKYHGEDTDPIMTISTRYYKNLTDGNDPFFTWVNEDGVWGKTENGDNINPKVVITKKLLKQLKASVNDQGETEVSIPIKLKMNKKYGTGALSFRISFSSNGLNAGESGRMPDYRIYSVEQRNFTAIGGEKKLEKFDTMFADDYQIETGDIKLTIFDTANKYYFNTTKESVELSKIGDSVSITYLVEDGVEWKHDTNVYTDTKGNKVEYFKNEKKIVLTVLKENLKSAKIGYQDKFDCVVLPSMKLPMSYNQDVIKRLVKENDVPGNEKGIEVETPKLVAKKIEFVYDGNSISNEEIDRNAIKDKNAVNSDSSWENVDYKTCTNVFFNSSSDLYNIVKELAVKVEVTPGSKIYQGDEDRGQVISSVYINYENLSNTSRTHREDVVIEMEKVPYEFKMQGFKFSDRSKYDVTYELEYTTSKNPKQKEKIIVPKSPNGYTNLKEFYINDETDYITSFKLTLLKDVNDVNDDYYTNYSFYIVGNTTTTDEQGNALELKHSVNARFKVDSVNDIFLSPYNKDTDGDGKEKDYEHILLAKPRKISITVDDAYYKGLDKVQANPDDKEVENHQGNDYLEQGKDLTIPVSISSHGGGLFKAGGFKMKMDGNYGKSSETDKIAENTMRINKVSFNPDVISKFNGFKVTYKTYQNDVETTVEITKDNPTITLTQGDWFKGELSIKFDALSHDLTKEREYVNFFNIGVISSETNLVTGEELASYLGNMGIKFRNLSFNNQDGSYGEMTMLVNRESRYTEGTHYINLYKKVGPKLVTDTKTETAVTFKGSNYKPTDERDVDGKHIYASFSYMGGMLNETNKQYPKLTIDVELPKDLKLSSLKLGADNRSYMSYPGASYSTWTEAIFPHSTTKYTIVYTTNLNSNEQIYEVNKDKIMPSGQYGFKYEGIELTNKDEYLTSAKIVIDNPMYEDDWYAGYQSPNEKKQPENKFKLEAKVDPIYNQKNKKLETTTKDTFVFTEKKYTGEENYVDNVTYINATPEAFQLQNQEITYSSKSTGRDSFNPEDIVTISSKGQIIVRDNPNKTLAEFTPAIENPVLYFELDSQVDYVDGSLRLGAEAAGLKPKVSTIKYNNKNYLKVEFYGNENDASYLGKVSDDGSQLMMDLEVDFDVMVDRFADQDNYVTFSTNFFVDFANTIQKIDTGTNTKGTDYLRNYNDALVDGTYTNISESADKQVKAYQQYNDTEMKNATIIPKAGLSVAQGVKEENDVDFQDDLTMYADQSGHYKVEFRNYEGSEHYKYYLYIPIVKDQKWDVELLGEVKKSGSMEVTYTTDEKPSMLADKDPADSYKAYNSITNPQDITMIKVEVTNMPANYTGNLEFKFKLQGEKSVEGDLTNQISLVTFTKSNVNATAAQTTHDAREWTIQDRKISGYAFEDENANGIYDTNEKKLSGVKFEVKDGDKVITSGLTKADGSYEIPLYHYKDTLTVKVTPSKDYHLSLMGKTVSKTTSFFGKDAQSVVDEKTFQLSEANMINAGFIKQPVITITPSDIEMKETESTSVTIKVKYMDWALMDTFKVEMANGTIASFIPDGTINTTTGVLTGTVKGLKPGSTQLTASVEDKIGEVVNDSTNVNIIPKGNITALAYDAIHILEGDSFDATKGISFLDSEGNPIVITDTSKVTIDISKVDNNTVGKYEITYNVRDAYDAKTFTRQIYVHGKVELTLTPADRYHTGDRINPLDGASAKWKKVHTDGTVTTETASINITANKQVPITITDAIKDSVTIQAEVTNMPGGLVNKTSQDWEYIADRYPQLTVANKKVVVKAGTSIDEIKQMIDAQASVVYGDTPNYAETDLTSSIDWSAVDGIDTTVKGTVYNDLEISVVDKCGKVAKTALTIEISKGSVISTTDRHQVESNTAFNQDVLKDHITVTDRNGNKVPFNKLTIKENVDAKTVGRYEVNISYTDDLGDTQSGKMYVYVHGKLQVSAPKMPEYKVNANVKVEDMILRSSAYHMCVQNDGSIVKKEIPVTIQDAAHKTITDQTVTSTTPQEVKYFVHAQYNQHGLNLEESAPFTVIFSGMPEIRTVRDVITVRVDATADEIKEAILKECNPTAWVHYGENADETEITKDLEYVGIDKVDTSKPKTTAKVTLRVEDRSGEVATKIITINVSDHVHMNFPSVDKLVGDKFDPKEGVEIYDGLGNKVNIDDVTIDVSKVDMSKPGEYDVTYQYTDSLGNECTEVNTIRVHSDVQFVGEHREDVFVGTNGLTKPVEAFYIDSKGFKINIPGDYTEQLTFDKIGRKTVHYTAQHPVFSHTKTMEKLVYVHGRIELKVSASITVKINKDIATVKGASASYKHVNDDGSVEKRDVAVTSSLGDTTTSNTPMVKHIPLQAKVEVVPGLEDVKNAEWTVTFNGYPIIETVNDNITVRVGATFDEVKAIMQASASVQYGKDGGKITSLTDKIDFSEVKEIDFSKENQTYKVKLHVTDADGATAEKEITITVSKKMSMVKPGVNKVVGDTFDPKDGVTIYDGKGNIVDLDKVTIDTSNVDMTKPGKYTVTYSYKDELGNVLEETNIVKVNGQLSFEGMEREDMFQKNETYVPSKGQAYYMNYDGEKVLVGGSYTSYVDLSKYGKTSLTFGATHPVNQAYVTAQKDIYVHGDIWFEKPEMPVTKVNETVDALKDVVAYYHHINDDGSVTKTELTVTADTSKLTSKEIGYAKTNIHASVTVNNVSHKKTDSVTAAFNGYPYINGASTIVLDATDRYLEEDLIAMIQAKAGMTRADKTNINLTSEIMYRGIDKVDTTKAGTYLVVLEVEDEDGFKVQKEVNFVVQERDTVVINPQPTPETPQPNPGTQNPQTNPQRDEEDDKFLVITEDIPLSDLIENGLGNDVIKKYVTTESEKYGIIDFELVEHTVQDKVGTYTVTVRMYDGTVITANIRVVDDMNKELVKPTYGSESDCIIHWIILLISLGYSIYAIVSMIKKHSDIKDVKKLLEEENNEE